MGECCDFPLQGYRTMASAAVRGRWAASKAFCFLSSFATRTSCHLRFPISSSHTHKLMSAFLLKAPRYHHQTPLPFQGPSSHRHWPAAGHWGQMHPGPLALLCTWGLSISCPLGASHILHTPPCPSQAALRGSCPTRLGWAAACNTHGCADVRRPMHQQVLKSCTWHNGKRERPWKSRYDYVNIIKNKYIIRGKKKEQIRGGRHGVAGWVWPGTGIVFVSMLVQGFSCTDPAPF